MAEGRGGAIDFAYLEGFAAGDRGVIDEVLGMFAEQAGDWAKALANPGQGWRDVVHTIKGTARGIGAFALGDLCARAEAEGEDVLPAVVAGLEAAQADALAYRARP